MQLDTQLAAKHRYLYNMALDALPAEIVKEIMENPHGTEARLLNEHVEALLFESLTVN